MRYLTPSDKIFDLAVGGWVVGWLGGCVRFLLRLRLSAKLSWRLADWLGQSLAIFKIKGVPKKRHFTF